MKSAPEPLVPGGLRLHFNENTAGCSEAVLAALAAMSRNDVACYPDVTEITGKVERWLGTAPGWVQITNGLDEGLQMSAQYAAWHLGARAAIPEIIVVEPSFEVYAFCADSVGATLISIAPKTDFEFPVEEVLSAITPNTRAIFLTDPNNPTGIGIPAGVVDRIAAAASHALVLVDEAYADFSRRTLIGPRLERAKNLVIGRTFAKGHGLAALRVGALVAHPETLDRLRRVQLPFTVNVAASTALSAALDDRSYLEWYVAQSELSREAIYAFCRRLDMPYWPSEGNFVLFRVGHDTRGVVEALAAERIFVRDKSDAPGCAGCIRLTAGVLEHTRRALTALEGILAPRTR